MSQNIKHLVFVFRVLYYNINFFAEMTEIPQFGVRKDIDIDLEKENLFSSSSNVNRKIAFQTSQVSSLVNSSSSSSSSTNQFFNRLLINIQVVIFGTKINTLLPFGPLAIVLHYFSNRNVCFVP